MRGWGLGERSDLLPEDGSSEDDLNNMSGEWANLMHGPEGWVLM